MQSREMNFAFDCGPGAEWCPPVTLEAQAGADAGFLEGSANTFREDMMERLARVRLALRAGDRSKLRVEVHSIQRAARHIGAPGVAQVAQELESSTGETVTVEVLDRVFHLQSAVHAASYAMARYFAEAANRDSSFWPKAG